MIIINDTLGAYGGTHTLMLRMCQWLTENGIHSAILCSSDKNREIVSKLHEIGTEIYCVDIQGIKKTAKILRKLQHKEEIKVINFMWNYYLDMEILKKKTGLTFANMIYCVHYGTFLKGNAYPKMIKLYIRSRYRRILKDMDANGSIAMMDEDTKEKTEEYFGLKLSKNNPFIRIPMICKEDEDSGQIIADGFSSDIVMTASRAEFPYKGYLLGIIDDYKILKKEFPRLKLEIVAGGEDEDIRRIRRKMSKLPKEYRKDIIFHDWMDYDTLKNEIKKCKIYIGMGTSILDAALEYKPAIPVKYNIYDSIAYGLFSRNPAYIGAPENCRNRAVTVLRQVMRMSFDDYLQESYKSFAAVKECYDIDKNMALLMDINLAHSKCILRNRDYNMHRMINMIHKLKMKRREGFDVEAVKMEKG